MRAMRLPGRRGDGSAVVTGWTAIYTLGLPRAIGARRRDEVAGDLDSESLDAMRHGTQATLFRDRMIRLLLGMPADLSWRLVDAPAMARDQRERSDWVPLSRWSSMLMAIVAVGSGGAFVILAVPLITGQVASESWTGWAPMGFAFGLAAVTIGNLLAVPWPGRGAAITTLGVVAGLVATPWLWGCWLLPLLAVLVRLYQASEGSARSRPR